MTRRTLALAASPLALALTLALALLSGPAARAGDSKARDELPDKAKSQFRVLVFKRGIASGFAHDHIMGVSDYQGAVHFDPADLTKSSVSIVVQAASLQVLDSKLSEDDRKEVKGNMDSDDVLHVEKYKTIEFKSKTIKLIRSDPRKDGKGTEYRLKITGDLKLHGTTKPVTFAAVVTDHGGHLVTEGEALVKQSLWGMEPYSAFLGAVGVKDVVKVTFKIVSKPKS